LLSLPVLITPIATTTHLNHNDDSIDPPLNEEEENDKQNSILRRKRNATTCGKKGSDLQRLWIKKNMTVSLKKKTNEYDRSMVIVASSCKARNPEQASIRLWNVSCGSYLGTLKVTKLVSVGSS
jgi:hypothetical protein